MQTRTSRLILGPATLLLASACGGTTDEPPSKDPSGNASQVPTTFSPSGDPPATQDPAPPTTSAPPTANVYMHSSTMLYRLDPTLGVVTSIGSFGGCMDDAIDLAIDANQNAYLTTFGGFYRVNLDTAQCSLIKKGAFPNSLSFVPKGTLDPSEDALVGYFGAQYFRIDLHTGNLIHIGSLSSGYSSSGDIVSVAGGGTFLTVSGNGCSDCLLQVNPATGDVVQNYGSLHHSQVFGLAYWGGTLYGFDSMGEMFSISWTGNVMGTSNLPFSNAPPNLSFFGAASTTVAPVQGSNGKTVPIKEIL